MVVLSSKNLVLQLFILALSLLGAQSASAIEACRPGSPALTDMGSPEDGIMAPCSGVNSLEFKASEYYREQASKEADAAKEKELLEISDEQFCKAFPTALKCNLPKMTDVEAASDSATPKPVKKAAAPSNVPVPGTRPDSTAGASQANACQSAAATAQSACKQTGTVVSEANNQISAITAKMQNAGTSPLAVCQDIASTSSAATSKLSAAKSSCQSAVTSCTNTCKAAVSAATTTGSSPARIAASGTSACATANVQLADADGAIVRLQNATSQANSCIAQATGQPVSNDQAAQNPAAASNSNATSDISSALGSFGSGSGSGSSSNAGAPDYSGSSSVDSIVNSKQSYTEPSSQVRQKSAGTSTTAASDIDLSGRSQNGQSGSAKERSHGQAVNQQGNSLKKMGGGSAFGPGKTKDDANLESMRANQQRSRFGNMEVNGRYLGGGAAPRYGTGATALGSGQNARAATAARGTQVARYDARKQQPDLNAFLPSTTDVRVGGRKPANVEAREFVGPHENMFKNQSSAFKRIFEN